MSSTQKIILTAPPTDLEQATALGLPVAHMAYRIGKGGRLYRADIPTALRGGLMVLDANGFDTQGDPTRLCREVIQECTNRKFEGILCHFDNIQVPFLTKTVTQLGNLTAQRGWSFYTTENYAGASEKSTILIPSALSSGSLEARLREAIQRYGANRIALAGQRIAKEYRLPAGISSGITLEYGDLAALVRRFSPLVSFDHNLCTHYFTYMEQGSAHFVLFDDSGSMLRKFDLARELGISRIFLAFPEVKDILSRLLTG